MLLHGIFVLAICAGSSPRQPDVNENIRLGMPSIEKPGYTYLVRKGYVLMHDNTKKGPLWAAFYLNKNLLSTKPRKGSFKPDPDLPVGSRAELSDYKGSGFSRGHMVASGDMRRAPDIQAETFYLSNMWPQLQELNGQGWGHLEDQMRSYCNTAEGAYIYVGPIFNKPLPASAKKLPATIGGNKVAVPKAFFRIIVRKNSAGKYEALAFEMPHMKIPAKADLAPYLVSIRKVENDTNLNFDSNLPKDVQDSFEKIKPKKLWAKP